MSQQYTTLDEPYSFKVDDVMWIGKRRFIVPLDEDGTPTYDRKVPIALVEMRGRKLWLTKTKYVPHQSAKEMARRQSNG